MWKQSEGYVNQQEGKEQGNENEVWARKQEVQMAKFSAS